MKSLRVSCPMITAFFFLVSTVFSIFPFGLPAHCAGQTNVPHVARKPIPFGMRIKLSLYGSQPPLWIGSSANSLFANSIEAVPFLVVDRGNGQVAFQGNGGLISVDPAGVVSLRRGTTGTKETFQWIAMTWTELRLVSLVSHHYLRLDRVTGALWADIPDTQTDISKTIQFEWRVVTDDLTQKHEMEQAR